jgi:hypothetical protein
VAATFLLAALPGMALWGLDGFAAGIAVMALVSLAVRTYYLRRLFHGFRMLPHAIRAVAPTIPAVLCVLALRLVVAHRTVGLALAEVAIYLAVTVAATYAFERPLLREAAGYLAGRRPAAAGA